MAQIII